VSIRFHNEDIPFDLRDKKNHVQWLRECIDMHGKKTGSLNFIFTSNDYLLGMNREYLNHNYFTDVISFNYSVDDVLSGDIFISIEQVKENAATFRENFSEELRRVMIHGVLHLAGFEDSTSEQQKRMREMENDALHLWWKKEGNDPGI
jgi:rRNA maturation RNase YbeY